LDEVQAMLGASLLFGRGSSLDKEFSDIIIGSQRWVSGRVVTQLYQVQLQLERENRLSGIIIILVILVTGV
jgi:hypothetical protein